MKRILAIFAVATALFTAQFASAQSTQQPHVSAVTYAGASGMNCYVNGVIYPVDGAFNVWARNVYGQWFIVGELVDTGRGYVVVRNDGVMFAAACY
jgi:hypothetical protein